MHNSTHTTNTIYSSLVNGELTGESSFTTALCLNGVNKFLRFFHSRDAEDNPELYWTSLAVTIGTTGYDLKTNITDLSSYKSEDIKVYVNSIASDNLYEKRTFDANQSRSWYILDNTLHISNLTESTSFVLVYKKVNADITDLDATIPINKEVEQALKYAICSYFYETEKELAKAQDYEVRSLEDIGGYFRTKCKLFFLS